MKTLLCSLAFVVLACSWTVGQSSEMDQAMTLFQESEYEKSNVLFAKVVRADTKNAQAWYMKGLTHLRLQQYERAMTDLMRAKELDYTPINVVRFGLAKCYAQLRKPASALEILQEAVDNGLTAYNRLESDVEFAPLLMRTEFQNIIRQARENAHPCLGDADHRRFDFWIGAWDVFTTQGRRAGYNVISKAKGGCAIHESYTTPNVYAGQSISFYDAKDDKWKQQWVDSAGGAILFVETNGYTCNLQFEGKSVNAQGESILRRMSFTHNAEADTVNQKGEASSDGGETWVVEYDLIYKRASE